MIFLTAKLDTHSSHSTLVAYNKGSQHAEFQTF
jgi:hypothetical protein